MKSKTLFTVIPLLLCSLFLKGQDFQGLAIYQSRTNFDVELDSTKMNKELQDTFKKMMKKFSEKTYELRFSKTESLYKEEEKLEQPGQGNIRVIGAGFDMGTLYKNTKDKLYIDQIESYGKDFLIKDTLEVLNWKLEPDTKMIGQHLCFKATMEKTMEEEAENNSIPKTKTIKVTAWYTPDIPISNGPQKYWGLPGLILELNQERTQLLCTKLILNPKEPLTFEKPKKGKLVTQKEYDAIMEKKMEEMLEMYEGNDRRKKGRGDRIIISN